MHLRSHATQAVQQHTPTSRDEPTPAQDAVPRPSHVQGDAPPVSAPVPKAIIRSVSYSMVTDGKRGTAKPNSAPVLSRISHPQIQPAAADATSPCPPPSISREEERKSSLRSLLLTSGSLKLATSPPFAKRDAPPSFDSPRPAALTSHPSVKLPVISKVTPVNPPVLEKTLSVPTAKPPRIPEASSPGVSPETTVNSRPVTNVSSAAASSDTAINPPPATKLPSDPSKPNVITFSSHHVPTTSSSHSKTLQKLSSGPRASPNAEICLDETKNPLLSSNTLSTRATAPSLTSTALQTSVPAKNVKKQLSQTSSQLLLSSQPSKLVKGPVSDPCQAETKPVASSPPSVGESIPSRPAVPISLPQAGPDPITDRTQASKIVSKHPSMAHVPVDVGMSSDELIKAPLSAEASRKTAPINNDSSVEMQTSEEPEDFVTPDSQAASAFPEIAREDSPTVTKRVTRASTKRVQSSDPVRVTTKNTEVVDQKKSPSRTRKRTSGRTRKRDVELIIIDEAPTPKKDVAIETSKRAAECIQEKTPPHKKIRVEKTQKSRRGLRGSQSTATVSTPKGELKNLIKTSPLLPNRYILRDGNTKSFWYTLLSGSKIAYSQWDLYSTSLCRMINEDALTVCADMAFRELKLGPKDGFEWMHETHLLEKVFGSKEPEIDNFAVEIRRWESMLRSKTLFVPIYRDSHWSLLALSSCSSILDMILDISTCGKQSMPRRPIQLVAAHFDSLPSLGHAQHLENIKLVLTEGITTLWEHKYKDFEHAGPPKVRGIIDSSLRILHVNVEEQPDGVTCGWRTIRHAMYVAENGVDSAASLKELAGKVVKVCFQDMARNTIAKVQNLSKPSSTDIPTLLYPLHSLVDEVVLSFFDATTEDLASKVASHLCSGKRENEAIKRSNATKKAQFQALTSVSENVVAEMRKRGLNKKQVLRKDVELSQNICTDIAKYLFHYPRGKNFAECLYYTRYHYPDSFLVCLGLDVLFSPKPRIFGESITPLSSRVRKSNSVHFQMSILRDQSKRSARYYDELARFRLLEMVEHFKGVGELVMKSCCKFALPSDEDDSELPAQMDTDDSSKEDDNSGVDEGDGVEVGKKEQEYCDVGLSKTVVDLTVNATQGEKETPNGWDFSNSISFHRPVDNELGHITSNVSAREIREHIDTCIASADKVANKAIMSRIKEFEKRCKRAVQLSNRSIKVSELKQRVTGESLGSIPNLFANHFAALLKEEIKQLWGHELPAEFFDGQLNNMIRSVLSAANTLYRRNGKGFFRLSLLKEDVLEIEDNVEEENQDDSDFTPVKKKLRRNQVRNPSGAAETKDDIDAQSIAPNTKEFVSLGLGTSTNLALSSSSLLWDVEFFSLLFYVLKGCQCHPRSEDSLCGDLENDTVTEESTPCNERLKAVKEECEQAISSFQRSASKLWTEEGDGSLKNQLQKMKLNILSHISTSITATRDRHSSSGSAACRSNVFCYDLPVIFPNAESTSFDVTDGKSFRIFHAGGQGGEEVMWNFDVRSLSYQAVQDDEAQIVRCKEFVFLSGIPIRTSKVPKTYILSADVDVLSTMDMWNEVDFEIDGEQYLGFRRFDVLKVVFSVPGGDSKADYNQAVIGIVLDDPVSDGVSGPRVGFSVSDRIRMRSIGPRTSKLNIIVQDDLAGPPDLSVSLITLIDKWRDHGRTQASCRLIPVEGIDIRRKVLQYGSLQQLAFLPKILRLSIVDCRMAECYELERRKRHYQMMKLHLPTHPQDKYCFTPYKALEEAWSEQIREAALSFDPALSDKQLSVIETALYGWKSDSSENGIMVLEQFSRELKGFIRDSKTITKDDIDWWGSNLCFLDGCPGSGKTRTLAALICTVLQRMEAPSSLSGYTGPPRVLVVTRSGIAADDIFMRVYKLLRTFFRQNTAKCNNALENMVRVGYSTGKEVVGRREVSRLAEDGSDEDVVDKAMVVFTTAADLCRKGLQSSKLPFSLLIVEEACKMEDESLIQAACKAFLQKDTQNFQRVSLLMVGDGQESQENIFTRAVKNGTGCHLSLRISFSQQYRSAPPITQFLSSSFYEGKLSSSEKHGMPWEEQDLFISLRSHQRFPIRNFVVIDISLEGKVAHDSAGSPSSLHNRFEKNVIAQMLLAWGNSDVKNGLQKMITILCMYPKQRIELARSLAKINLTRIHVRTMDQMVGLENDIIILSLVRTRSHGMEEDDDVSANNIDDAQFIRFAASRARKAFIVVGNAKFMGEQSSHWAHLFQHCLSCVQEGDNATHGYFRPRYAGGGKDLRLVPFSPSYLQV